MMRWPTLLISMGWLAIFVVDLSGREPDFESPPPQTATDYLPTPTLIRQHSSANFQLILGRLQLDPVRYRKGSFSVTHSESEPKLAPITESMTVNGVRGKPSMQYVMTRPQVRVSIDADSDGNWRIQTERQWDDRKRKVFIEQRVGKPLRMQCTITSKMQPDAESYTVQGSTLLHLREADRVAFIEDVEPILDELLFPYRIQELADQAHAASLIVSTASAVYEAYVDDATIHAWIHELRSPSRLSRTDAERKLKALGISLLPRLANLDARSLDAEQRQRLCEIQAGLTPKAEDDAARLALLIRDDLEYWRLAANRLNDQEQQFVIHRFQKLGGQSPFPPSESARIATRPAMRGR